MNPTQEKVNRNLAGLSFLNSRPDTKDMLPQTKILDNCETIPAFYCCRAIMRDNLTVVCISLRVLITTYAEGSEKYTHRDIHGRGTTFEMALFDLSAQLIKIVEDDDVIGTESIPIIEEGKTHDRTEDTNEGVRTDKPDSPASTSATAEQNAGKGMAARSDNPRGSGATKQRNSKRGGKAPNGSGRGRGPQRSGG